MEDMAKIKDRIAKLLAKANNTACSVAEAEAFNAKALELMQRYNLERAEVEHVEKDVRRTHKTLQVLKRPWSSMILHGITHLYYCKWFFTRSGRTDTITIVGEESNVAVCHAIAVMVLRAVQQEARTTAGGRSFMTGAAQSIYQRCMEMAPTNQLASKDPSLKLTGTQSTALAVLGNNEAQGNLEYIRKELGLNLGQARKSSAKVNSSSAFTAGKAFGQSVPLRNNLLR